MKKLILLSTLLFTTFACQGQSAKSSASSTSTTSSRTSVSVSDSNEVYSYSAIFDRPKSNDAIKEIEKVFGKPVSEGKNMVWREGDSLEIKARDGKIAIEFVKGSTELYEKVKKLGESISKIVNEKK
jgi:hypothetical protein